MPLYIPWLTDTLKKKALSYLLNHYLGQFFEEKLTLEQLSVDIIKGQGSIKNLSLDVDGLNDELDFIPFKFLHGCRIGNISVKVPWASLPGEACRVELDGALFECRLKTPADIKGPCNESTLLTRSLMTSSMQMAEDIVTTSDDGYENAEESPLSEQLHNEHESLPSTSTTSRRKNPNQMFEGLEMFAQFIDSVLRRTKLTACNTIFRIHPHSKKADLYQTEASSATSTTSNEDFGDPMADSVVHETTSSNSESSSTVEFFIRFFRCEEIINQSTMQSDINSHEPENDASSSCPINSMPETIIKQLTLEDVEMRIDGAPVSNLVGKHTITIKFNGQKSEISIFLGSPLLAVISHHQLKTFFKVFENASDCDMESSMNLDPNQKVMNSEDYAKIENQLLETASFRNITQELKYQSSHHLSSQTGRRWMDGGELFSDLNQTNMQGYQLASDTTDLSMKSRRASNATATLDNLEAFSCELKLPGIWLCILKDGETLPPLIKPYADSNNSFLTINKYIDGYLNLPHLRLLALKVALNLTSTGIDLFLGDLDISEYFQKDSLRPTLHLLHNDLGSCPIDSSRYKVRMKNQKELTIELLTKTRLVLDPTIIDRMVYDYKLIQMNSAKSQKRTDFVKRDNPFNISVTLRGQQLKVELLCPIPDLSEGAQNKTTQLRPQSFLFEFNDVCMKWHCDKLTVDASDLIGFIKAQPKQINSQAVKFVEATSQDSNRINLSAEFSPSNLDTEFPDDVEQALNESSMFDSIYVDRGKESCIPIEAFETKRKVVRFATTSSSAAGSQDNESREHQCDSEKIVTPGSRDHLTDYINQTVMSTKLFLNIHLPLCELEFEDKEQLDLIYNRFANDFVFWQPKISLQKAREQEAHQASKKGSGGRNEHTNSSVRNFNEDSTPSNSDRESEVSFHSIGIECPSLDVYENEMTLKLLVDNLLVKFNHQSCAQALKQELSVENLLLGVVIDINRRPNTILSLISDNLELASDSEIVFGDNHYNNRSSTFALTVEIKRPTKDLKDIKLAIEIDDGLFTDFKTDIYTRFWRSINVSDEPITGYLAPKILTELHINIKDTAMALVKEGARPALLTIDELYITSMIMEKTSQFMIRSIADEVSLYLKRDMDGAERIKNYVCLMNSGSLDLNFKLSQDGKIEFNVINCEITVRACQDSLSALIQLFNVLFKSSIADKSLTEAGTNFEQESCEDKSIHNNSKDLITDYHQTQEMQSQETTSSKISEQNNDFNRENNLLEDAMNDYKELPELSNQASLDFFDEEYSDTLVDDPPFMQHISSSHENACLLDESNPMLDNLFGEPLLPSKNDDDNEDIEGFMGTSNVSVNESGFFIIGDDDVGAGIIDKQQKEPLVRKLTQGPINIIDNYFKMTKPRTIPEMLASSVERYVLEEMTLVVSLFGGRDFNEDKQSEKSSAKEGSVAGDDDTISVASNSKSPTSVRNRASSMTYMKQNTQAGAKASALPEYKASLKTKRSRKKHFSEGCKESEEPAARVRFGEGAVNLWESLDLMSSPDFKNYRQTGKTQLSSDSKTAGGAWRRLDVCIQLTLSKVKLLYEIAMSDSPISWRFMLFIHDIEIRDKLQASDINKMLYEYCTESMPKRNTQILTIKNVATINPTDGCEECDLRVSIKPLRLNIDQDTLIFLIDFFTSVSKAFNNSEQATGTSNYGGQNIKINNAPPTVHKQSPPKQNSPPNQRYQSSSKPPLERRSNTTCSDTDSFQETQSISSLKSRTTTLADDTSSNTSDLPTHCHRDPSDQHPLYIKSFTFSPDVPIRLDYHAKHLDFEQGALAGILMGLAHLDHSELVLKRVQAKHGMRGLDRVLLFTVNAWLSDIKRNQLPSILGGVGPMHSVIQLFQGMRDLIWMPIDHYRKDKRLVRGLQRGASSFSSSTAMAAINLVNHFISIIQCTAQIAHDIVTPPNIRALGPGRASGAYRRAGGGGLVERVNEYSATNHNHLKQNGTSSSGLLNQPRNFCEGVAVGFNIIKDGLNDTARNVAVGMQADDVRSAMGELVRQIPSTLLSPIITATEGAQNVLVGIRNQIAPDARREDQEKWKRRVRGK